MNLTEFYNLPVDIYIDLMRDYEISAGLKSGTEVFSVSIKNWKQLLKSNLIISKSHPDTPEYFIKALKEAKKRTGKNSVSLQEVFKKD